MAGKKGDDASGVVRAPYTGDRKFEPKTELGKKLLEIRNRAIENGMDLLSTEEVLEEVRSRRA